MSAKVHFVLPEVEQGPDGEISILSRTASLSVRPGISEDELEIKRKDSGGEYSVMSLSCVEMRNISLRAHEGQVVWESIESRQSQVLNTEG